MTTKEKMPEKKSMVKFEVYVDPKSIASVRGIVTDNKGHDESYDNPESFINECENAVQKVFTENMAQPNEEVLDEDQEEEKMLDDDGMPVSEDKDESDSETE